MSISIESVTTEITDLAAAIAAVDPLRSTVRVAPGSNGNCVLTVTGPGMRLLWDKLHCKDGMTAERPEPLVMAAIRKAIGKQVSRILAGECQSAEVKCWEVSRA